MQASVRRSGIRCTGNISSTDVTRPLALAFCILGAVLLASAQESAPPPKTSSIAGTVVQEPGSRPLKKVLVQVIAEENRARPIPARPTPTAISTSRTSHRDVTASSSRGPVSSESMNAGSNLTSTLSQFKRGSRWKTCFSNVAHGGHQRPRHGRRWRPDVRRQSDRAKEKTREGSPGRRRDRGHERSRRIPSLRFISRPVLDRGHAASGFPRLRTAAGKTARRADNPSDAQSDTRYLTTYYPGTYDASQASAVTLKAGDEMPVNFTLVPARTYRVRGIVTGVTSGQKPVVELFSKAGDSIRVEQ